MGSSLTCVDLFSGCGGLSLGLKRAGFEVKLAVEKSPMAAETYFHNFIEPIREQHDWQRYLELPIAKQAKRGLIVNTLSEVLRSKELLNELRDADLDLVAGGPPCQGFSLAGKRNPDDVRNLLPWQFLTFVERVRPKSVLIENVSGIRSDFQASGKKSPFHELCVALAETEPGYVVQPMLLNAAHFGVPQLRPRVFLAALRSDFARTKNLRTTEQVWDSQLEAKQIELLQPRPSLAPKRTHFEGTSASRHLNVEDAIADLVFPESIQGNNFSDYASEMRRDSRFLTSREKLSSAFERPTNHNPRRHSDLVKDRFRLYQFLRDAGIHSGVLALPKRSDLSVYARRKSLQKILHAVEYPVCGGDGKEIAVNQRNLIREITRLSTKKRSQRALSWERPAPTVLSLPDDYIHPSMPRIPTVRELARFQSFPDAFEFRSKETTGAHRRRFEVPQYTQVGNAVPPKLAEAIAMQVAEVIGITTSNQMVMPMVAQ